MSTSVDETPTVRIKTVASKDDTAPLDPMTEETMEITAVLDIAHPTRPHLVKRAWRYFVDVGVMRLGIVKVGILPLCAIVGLYIGAILAPDAVPNVVKDHMPGITAQAPVTTTPQPEKQSDKELPSAQNNIPAQVSKTQESAATKSPETSPSASVSASASTPASSNTSSSSPANPTTPAEPESSAPASSPTPSSSASASPTPEDTTSATPTVAPTSETPVSPPATEASAASVDDTSTPTPTS